MGILYCEKDNKKLTSERDSSHSFINRVCHGMLLYFHNDISMYLAQCVIKYNTDNKYS